ncbi:uncharacterized protein isoform X2 [Choristoneura fumiferana]|uniref:uncharacterized protein isoform X2 n=1 Tax=Choristoneura fumiferana TaxID=7141 RepID=UPI003D15F02B
MVFKLVRVDTEESTKIQLPVGTHLIGRHSCLDCDDKRISRNHGRLIVTEDSLVIEALHQNPCFFTKKGSKEKEILRKLSKETLLNGDRFGLLPGNYWYEVLLCSTENDSQATDVSNTPELVNGESEETNESNKPNECESKPNNENVPVNEKDRENDETIQDRDASKVNSNTDVGFDDNSELLDFDLNETVENVRAESPSLLDKEQEATDNQPTANPEASPNTTIEEPVADAPHPSTNDPDQPHSPTPKRSHSPEGTDDEGAKKIKTEPVDVKDEPVIKDEPVVNAEPVVKQEPDDVKAGPSNDQAGASANAADAAKAPPSPAKAPNRERCLYGANCYRRNPQHKAQFSHPSDADWGAGERAACPYGAACRKRDPRHWQIHDHPPGTRPPPPAGARVVERRGNIFYINAQSVNFYDDHFQVEDSEGDSVDFDYEF